MLTFERLFVLLFVRLRLDEEEAAEEDDVEDEEPVADVFGMLLMKGLRRWLSIWRK